MSLHVYGDKKDIPVQYIRLNDAYFDMGEFIDDDITRQVIKLIDKAEYYDKWQIKDRNGIVINRSCLSTGAKTLLNIHYNPDKCFDMLGCGLNARNAIHLLRDGHVYWESPRGQVLASVSCDIIMRGMHFMRLIDFFAYCMDEGR